MNEYPHFKDFADAQDNDALEGKKANIESILNKEILITDYQFRKSRYYDGDYIILQFQNGDGLNVVFTAAGVIHKQLERYKDRLPFYGTIVKRNKYFTLS